MSQPNPNEADLSTLNQAKLKQEIAKLTQEVRKLEAEAEKAGHRLKERAELDHAKAEADAKKAEVDRDKAEVDREKARVDLDRARKELEQRLAADVAKAHGEVKNLGYSRFLMIAQGIGQAVAGVAVVVTAANFLSTYNAGEQTRAAEEVRHYNERLQTLLDQVAKYPGDRSIANGSVSNALDQVTEMTSEDWSRRGGGRLRRLLEALSLVDVPPQINPREERGRVVMQLAHTIEGLNFSSARDRALAVEILRRFPDDFDREVCDATMRREHVERVVLPAIANALNEETEENREFWSTCVSIGNDGPLVNCAPPRQASTGAAEGGEQLRVDAQGLLEVAHILELARHYVGLAQAPGEWVARFRRFLPEPVANYLSPPQGTSVCISRR